LVEQKTRPAFAAALDRRRIRRMAPARAEVEWVMDRESMWFLVCSRASHGRSVRRRPAGRSVRGLRGTEAVLVLIAWRVAGAEIRLL
jgi:hypothetical protein